MPPIENQLVSPGGGQVLSRLLGDDHLFDGRVRAEVGLDDSPGRSDEWHIVRTRLSP